MNMLDYYQTMYAIYMNPEYAPMLADKFEECGMEGHAESLRQSTPFANSDSLSRWLYDQYTFCLSPREKGQCDLCYRILINEKRTTAFYSRHFPNAKWSNSPDVKERMQSLTYDAA